MSKYVFGNGIEVDLVDSYLGDYYREPIATRYTDDKFKDRSTVPDEKWNGCETYEEACHLWSEKDGSMNAVRTYALAKRKEIEVFKEVEYDSPTAMNCEYKTKIEVVLNSEGFLAKWYYEWKGNATLADILSNIGDTLMEAIEDGSLKGSYKTINSSGHLEAYGIRMYKNNGDFVDAEYYNQSEIEALISSVRVVDFQYKILY